MELIPLSFKETFQLISELNRFVDEQDRIIDDMQQRYSTSKKELTDEYNRNISKFNADCDAAIFSTKSKAQELIDEAVKIQKEIRSLDKQLSSIDKYYVKTKVKKESELNGIKDACYDSGTDFFKVLEQIKIKYTKISHKYMEDILPNLINGLNYLFSSKRKGDYEELITLINTVDGFVKEINDTMPELTAEAVNDMRVMHELQRKELLESRQNAMDALEVKYNRSLTNIAAGIDAGLNSILPMELSGYIIDLIDTYAYSYGKVNSTGFVADNILFSGLVNYPISDFIQSQTLISFISEHCKGHIVKGNIRFPLICSTSSALPVYIEKDGSNAEAVSNILQGIMFSFLSSVSVGKLRLNVIDCENHGNSVNSFFDAKKKMPELFDKQFHTTHDEAVRRIKELNDKIECISQNQLGTSFASIFEYAESNEESDFNIELLVIFDFPKGLNEQAMSYLKNIIVHGSRCGIYVIMSESSEISAEIYSREFTDNITKIKGECLILKQQGSALFAMGLQCLFYSIPSMNDFATFFSKYLLVDEGIKNRGIAFSDSMKKLITSKNSDDLAKNINKIQMAVDNYNNTYGKVPALNEMFPEQVVIGSASYPDDVFGDCYGYSEIKEKFGRNSGRIAMPLTLDLRRSSNILISCSESKTDNIIAFTHHVIWGFLSSIPVTKLNVCVFDLEKKGSSVIPFLDFRKKCPDIFDEKIHTDSEDIYDSLSKINRFIDSSIQEKLGNRYDSMVEYNESTPNRAEVLTLLIIYDFPAGFDSRSLDLLQNILKNGGKCGVYVLVCYNRDVYYSSFDSIDERINGFRKHCTQIEEKDREFTLLPFNLPIEIKAPISNANINAFADEYSRMSEKIKTKGLDFEDILDKDLFSRSFKNGLAIPVGVGDADAVIPIIFGKGSSHHALIAGATGSGKSTLLHTLIMSAMLHYTPDCLNLYLMDFKSGTEFKIYDNKHLPHIKLLALDAMQEFGESILENLVTEMNFRSDRFKSVGVSNLNEFIEISEEHMPKILVIMDEFQILFNDTTNRKVAYNCAELIKRIVTEGRSYGIHLLMATQSTKIITDLTIATGTIEQMRIRIGLKCGEYDAHYLFSERNDVQALNLMKGSIGTAVMNQEFTEESNIGFRAAYCSDEIQKKYLEKISENFSEYPCDMQTFEGNRTIKLLDAEDINSASADEENSLSITVGTLIKVAPPLRVVFDRRRKHNTLICGSNDKMAENLANIYSLSILRNNNCKLYCFDGERLLDSSIADELYCEYSRFANRFIIAESRGDIIKQICDIYELYLKRKKGNDSGQIYILIKNLQFLDIVKTMFKGEMIDESGYLEPSVAPESVNDMFDFGVEADTFAPNVSDKLLKLIDDGSAYGIHFVVMCLEFQSVKESMYFGENILSKFPERYVFALNDNDADSLIEGVSVASLRDNTVYYSDSVKSVFQVKPYVFPTPYELKKLSDKYSKGDD